MYNKKVAYYSIFCCNLHEKKNHEILNALHLKPLYNINRSEKWGKKIQTAGYNGARIDLEFVANDNRTFSFTLVCGLIRIYELYQHEKHNEHKEKQNKP